MAWLVKGHCLLSGDHQGGAWENISIYKKHRQSCVLRLGAVCQYSGPVYRAAARTQNCMIWSSFNYACVYHPLTNNSWGNGWVTRGRRELSKPGRPASRIKTYSVLDELGFRPSHLSLFQQDRDSAFHRDRRGGLTTKSVILQLNILLP